MDPLAFMADKFKAIGQRSHKFFDGLIHRHRDSPTLSRNPIEILKRLQREAFSDLMKLRDRQDKVERILSLYKTARGSPFQEVGTVFSGEVDFLCGLVLMSHNVKRNDRDAIDQAGLRTGLDARFSFETTVRDNDALVVEFFSGQKQNNYLFDYPESAFTLAKVSYTANAGDWLSAFVIPMGGKCSDVAIVTNPLHQGKGLTNISSSGPPLLSQLNGTAVGVMVKKSNVVASLAQFVSGRGMDQNFERSFGTFGQVVCQLPRGTKLSLLGLHQSPNSSPQSDDHGPFTLALGGYNPQEVDQPMLEDYKFPVRLRSQRKVPTGSIALMLESEIDEYTKIGGWIELQDSDTKQLKWAVSMSDDSEDSLGWGLKFSGMSDRQENLDQFKVESFMKLNLGKRFSVKPGVAYIKDGNARMTALMLRSNWSL